MTEGTRSMKLLEDIEEFAKERKQHDQKNMELVDRARKFTP